MSESDTALARRQALIEIKKQLGVSAPGNISPLPTELTKQTDVHTFMRVLNERNQQRKHQLTLVKQLFEDPMRFGLDTQLIPSSSTPEEIEARCKDLEYRRDLIKIILEITEGELTMLRQALATPQHSDTDK